jgi:hypothetical protein
MTISAGIDAHAKGGPPLDERFSDAKYSTEASVWCIMHNPEMKSNNLDCDRLSASRA